MNEKGQVALRYFLHGCWVSEFTAVPELDANANAIAIETIKIELEGWERDPAATEPDESDPARRLPAEAADLTGHARPAPRWPPPFGCGGRRSPGWTVRADRFRAARSPTSVARPLRRPRRRPPADARAGLRGWPVGDAARRGARRGCLDSRPASADRSPAARTRLRRADRGRAAPSPRSAPSPGSRPRSRFTVATDDGAFVVRRPTGADQRRWRLAGLRRRGRRARAWIAGRLVVEGPVRTVGPDGRGRDRRPSTERDPLVALRAVGPVSGLRRRPSQQRVDADGRCRRRPPPGAGPPPRRVHRLARALRLDRGDDPGVPAWRRARYLGAGREAVSLMRYFSRGCGPTSGARHPTRHGARGRRRSRAPRGRRRAATSTPVAAAARDVDRASGHAVRAAPRAGDPGGRPAAAVAASASPDPRSVPDRRTEPARRSRHAGRPGGPRPPAHDRHRWPRRRPDHDRSGWPRSPLPPRLATRRTTPAPRVPPGRRSRSPSTRRPALATTSGDRGSAEPRASADPPAEPPDPLRQPGRAGGQREPAPASASAAGPNCDHSAPTWSATRTGADPRSPNQISPEHRRDRGASWSAARGTAAHRRPRRRRTAPPTPGPATPRLRLRRQYYLAGRLSMALVDSGRAIGAVTRLLQSRLLEALSVVPTAASRDDVTVGRPEPPAATRAAPAEPLPLRGRSSTATCAT